MLCLLLKHTFAIIFPVLPSGCGGTTEIIIILPPQLRKAVRKQEELLLFSLVLTIKPNVFITEAAAAGAIFPSQERTERRNLTGAAVTLHTLQKSKREVIQMHDSSLFPKRCRMRGATMSLALERSFAQHYHYQLCIFKAKATDLQPERHKTWPGQAVALWNALAIKNEQKISQNQNKTRPRNKILKYH